MTHAATNRFRFIQWDITSHCNLSCVHCRSESFYGNDNLDKDMPLPTVKERLDSLYEKGVRRIHFLGGEPFSRRDLPEIVRHASCLGILCSINTNGTLISRERAEAIVSAGTYLLTFSIDGCDEATNDRVRGAGTFRRILRGIRHLQEAKRALGAGTRLICSHVLMRSNLANVEGMVDLCTSLGLQNLIVTNLRRMGGATKSFAELAITEEEKLEAAERLILHGGKPGQCHVQVEVVSLLGKAYLNARYNARISIRRGGCDAVSRKAYMQPDGALFPCQDVANAIGSSEERDTIQAQGIASWESDRFSPILAGTSSRDIYDSYVPCPSCPALGVLCTPCPLPGLKGAPMRHESCLVALRAAHRACVDLKPEIERAARASLADRIVQDPTFRTEFFTSGDVAGFLDRARCDPALARRLSRFSIDTMEELQSLLRAAAEAEGAHASA